MLDWAQVKKFKPTLIVTLVDNVYQASETIKKHSAAQHDDATQNITLKDIMEWRMAELMIGQCLAEHCSTPSRPVNHYLVAKRHGPEVLYQLLFESVEAMGKVRGKLKVYASFPISKARGTEQRAVALCNEVAAFRKALKDADKWIVFDPWTIDERLLLPAVSEAVASSPVAESLVVENEWDGKKHTVSLEEARAVVSDIRVQIPLRDYHLVNQCDQIVAFRPALSGGVHTELGQARSQGKWRGAVWPSDDDSPSDFEGIDLNVRMESLSRLLPRIPSSR